jgi:uncharacterized protein
MASPLRSCLYEGRVMHERRLPVAHRFAYRLFMVGLDLAELDLAFRGRWFWSAHGPNLAWFRRGDHFGDPAVSLDTAVRDLVERRLGRRPQGRILLVTHLRYFGFVINPISIYLCLQVGADEPEAIVLEVTNTPWGERCLYAVDARHAHGESGSRVYRFAKDMHVSPFMAMDYDYALQVQQRPETLAVRLENHGREGVPFVAVLRLRHRPITGFNLARALLAYPFMTLQVLGAIYFEAARLAWKKTPFHPHPARRAVDKEASL